MSLPTLTSCKGTKSKFIFHLHHLLLFDYQLTETQCHSSCLTCCFLHTWSRISHPCRYATWGTPTALPLIKVQTVQSKQILVFAHFACYSLLLKPERERNEFKHEFCVSNWSPAGSSWLEGQSSSLFSTMTGRWETLMHCLRKWRSYYSSVFSHQVKYIITSPETTVASLLCTVYSLWSLWSVFIYYLWQHIVFLGCLQSKFTECDCISTGVEKKQTGKWGRCQSHLHSPEKRSKQNKWKHLCRCTNKLEMEERSHQISYQGQTLSGQCALVSIPLPSVFWLPGCTYRKQSCDRNKKRSLSGQYTSWMSGCLNRCYSLSIVKSEDHNNTRAQILFNKASYQGSLYPLYSYTFHVLWSPGINVALCIFESTESIVFPMFLEKRLISYLFFSCLSQVITGF